MLSQLEKVNPTNFFFNYYYFCSETALYAVLGALCSHIFMEQSVLARHPYIDFISSNRGGRGGAVIFFFTSMVNSIWEREIDRER